jgi:hypothetical protein
MRKKLWIINSRLESGGTLAPLAASPAGTVTFGSGLDIADATVSIGWKSLGLKLQMRPIHMVARADGQTRSTLSYSAEASAGWAGKALGREVESRQRAAGDGQGRQPTKPHTRDCDSARVDVGVVGVCAAHNALRF